jgi:hypothetical protein
MYNRMLYILIPQEIRVACTCTREISNMHLNSNMRDVFAHASIYVYTARDTYERSSAEVHSIIARYIHLTIPSAPLPPHKTIPHYTAEAALHTRIDSTSLNPACHYTSIVLTSTFLLRREPRHGYPLAGGGLLFILYICDTVT